MKIYVRERQKVGEGVESPKYRIVAITGGSYRLKPPISRKFEIEQIAKDVGAEVVFMKPVADDHRRKIIFFTERALPCFPHCSKNSHRFFPKALYVRHALFSG